MFDDDPSLIEIIHASLLMNKSKQFIVRSYLINKKKSIKSRHGLPTTQSPFTCLKLAIETLEKGVNYVQS